jgi:hypothetical protein
MREAQADRAADEEARCPQACLTLFVRGSRAAASKKLTSPMKALVVRQAQQTRPRMKERKSRRNCLRARVPVPLPIHFYCKEPSARVSREMVRADSAKTDWFRAILPVKAGQVDKGQAADVAGQVAARREEDKAASVDPAAEAVALAEHLAECSGAEEVVAPVAAGAEG